jgi:DNA-binding MarR family transcriptional regulator
MIHPTSVTNIVDRLEDAGLLERAPHPTDRRITLARITPRGRELTARATKAVNATSFGLDCLTQLQLEDLVRLLTPLRRAVGDFETPPGGTNGGPDPS